MVLRTTRFWNNSAPTFFKICKRGFCCSGSVARFWRSRLGPSVYLLKYFLEIIWLSNISTLSVHDEGCSRSASCANYKGDNVIVKRKKNKQ